MKKIHFLIASLLVAGSTLNSYAIENGGDSNTYIIGHWNYSPNSVIPVYVISEGDDVELFINEISTGHARHESNHLFTFDNVNFQPGTLTAVSYDSEGKEIGRYNIISSGVPAQLKLSVLPSGEGNQVENSDDIIIQCRLTDFYGKRCLADNRTVLLEIEEPAEWGQSLGQTQKTVKRKQIVLNKGVNSVKIKKPTTPGEIKITAKASGLAPDCLLVYSN